MVDVRSADQLDAMVANIADIEGEMAAQSPLEVKSPSFDVRRAELGINFDGVALGRGDGGPGKDRFAIAAGGDKWENAAIGSVQAPVVGKAAGGCRRP